MRGAPRPRALCQAFTPPVPTASITPILERQVLTLWIAHSSDRDIQQGFLGLTQ